MYFWYSSARNFRSLLNTQKFRFLKQGLFYSKIDITIAANILCSLMTTVSEQHVGKISEDRTSNVAMLIYLKRTHVFLFKTRKWTLKKVEESISSRCGFRYHTPLVCFPGCLSVRLSICQGCEINTRRCDNVGSCWANVVTTFDVSRFE